MQQSEQSNTGENARSEEARLKVLDNLPGITPNDKYYFGYQYGLGVRHIVPYLRSKNVPFSGRALCEIGCGEGGVLAALADEGASNSLGIDIRQEAIDRAQTIFPALGLNAEFAIHDITGQRTPEKWAGKFDFVTLRDVIEHLDDTEGSLRHVMEFMKPGAFLYIVFPPYYSPYGAHQHALKNIWGKLPFIQFLPNVIFKQLIKSGYYLDVEEVTRLREIRLTVDKFRNAASRAGLELVDEELYFLRPVFKLKFGLNPIRVNALRKIPYLREVVALEASYLLKKKQ